MVKVENRQVTFRYKKPKSSRWRITTSEVMEFTPLMHKKQAEGGLKRRFFSNLVEEIIYSRGQTQTFRDISAWATLPRLKEYALWVVNMSNFRKAMTFFASASRGDKSRFPSACVEFM